MPATTCGEHRENKELNRARSCSLPAGRCALRGARRPHNHALYLRGYNGRNSRWYQAAVRQKAGRIIAAGMTTEVTFEPVNGPINDRIDDAYRTKYRGSPYLGPMIGARARSATVRIMPRETNA